MFCLFFGRGSEISDVVEFAATLALQGAAKKVDPSIFLSFSQQPFGILIWNFSALFTETFYI